MPACCCSPRRSRPTVGGRFWRPCYFANSLLRWSLTHSLNSAMCLEGRAVYRRFARVLTHPPDESRTARIIRFATAESVGHALTRRVNSGSVSATDINRSQPFSGVSVATICATTLEIPAFSRHKRRSTEPKAVERFMFFKCGQTSTCPCSCRSFCCLWRKATNTEVSSRLLSQSKTLEEMRAQSAHWWRLSL